MNPNESTQETQFVFRRLQESFPQFLADLWQSVPVWLLVVAAAVVLARLGYGRHYRKTHGAAKPDATLYRLGWASVLAVGALVAWVLVAFYNRDTEQMKGSAAVASLGGSNDAMWYAFVGGVLGLGSLFVVWMYVKDSRSVRWYWAASLALVRIAVYAILLVVFLLPSKQTWERTEKRSRVVVVVDITNSMLKQTDETTAGPGRKPRMRMDLLIEFLTDEKVGFVQNILNTNPIALYPFGTRLDETPRIIARGKPWGKEDWQAFATYDFRPLILDGEGENKATLSDDGKAALKAINEWVQTGAGNPEWATNLCDRGKKDQAWTITGMPEPDMKTLREILAKVERRIDVARTIAGGTNVPDSVLAAVNRESPNMVQGVIVFSDGRSNLGSDSGIRELRDRAAREKIPVFTVAVGQDAPQRPEIRITDVQTDDTAPPDQGFKVSVEVDGANLAGQAVPVKLDVFYQGAEGKRVLPDPDLTLELDRGHTPPVPYQVTFAPGDPPHGAVEFVIDPVKLAADPTEKVRALTEESKHTAIKKPVLKEGKWMVRARIAKLPDETLAEPEHVRERPNIQVLQKKLRVLLVAGAPGREFQFIRNFLAREVQDNRAEVTLLVQNEAGSTGNLTPNPTEKIILHFPNRLVLDEKPAAAGGKDEPKAAEPRPDGKDQPKLDPKELDKDRPYNLNEYDLIIGFDMDWSEISQQQADDLLTWVERQGGGFIFIAGTVNTEQLARVPKDPEDKSPNSRLRPVLQFLPVEPDDIVANSIKGVPRTYRRLYLNPLPASELLKLYEPPTPEQLAQMDEDRRAREEKRAEKFAKDPIAGWELFFTDRETYVKSEDQKVERYPHRGFYSCYPIKDIKPDARVLAEFATVDEPNVDRRPWLVVNNPLAPWRTCFLGSGELYRMFSYDKEFYERFWGKLMREMASKRNTKAPRGRVLVSKEVISGTPIRVKAQVLNTSARPYPIDGTGKIDPKCFIRISTPNGDKDIGPYEMQPVPSPGGFDGYYQTQILADAKQFPPAETEYKVVVEVPAGGGTLEGKFLVTRSDPEMDNTRPDFGALVALASDYDPAFQTRLSKDTRATLANYLPKEGGVSKLMFKLGDTDFLKLIPESFKTEERRADNRGPMHDLWDEGIQFPDRQPESGLGKWAAGFYAGKTFPVSWVLLVVVLLLCVEWTTRKLLRLA